MGYVKSRNIEIFPLSTGRVKHRTNRLLYEQNIANISRQITNDIGFIIETPIPQIINNNVILTSNSRPLVFNIYGYYVNVKPYSNENIILVSNVTSGGGTVYAQITLTNRDAKTSEATDVYEIIGTDNTTTSNFEGVKFICSSEVKVNTVNEKYLPLYNISADGVVSIINDSYIKFNTNSVKIVRIDGRR